MTKTSNYNSTENKWKRTYLVPKVYPTVCDRIKRYVDAQPKPLVRPPAVYDNKSREELIEQILSHRDE